MKINTDTRGQDLFEYAMMAASIALIFAALSPSAAQFLAKPFARVHAALAISAAPYQQGRASFDK